MTEIFKFCKNATYSLRSGQVLVTNNFSAESISRLSTSLKALKSGTQVTVLVNCVRHNYKMWVIPGPGIELGTENFL